MHELFLLLTQMLALALPTETVLQVATGRRRRPGTDEEIYKFISPMDLGY